MDVPNLPRICTAAEIQGLEEGYNVDPSYHEYFEALEEAAKTSDSLHKQHKPCLVQEEANKTETNPTTTMGDGIIDDLFTKNGIVHPDNRFMMPTRSAPILTAVPVPPHNGPPGMDDCPLAALVIMKDAVPDEVLNTKTHYHWTSFIMDEAKETSGPPPGDLNRTCSMTMMQRPYKNL
jgi:hypothetical protein